MSLDAGSGVHLAGGRAVAVSAGEHMGTGANLEDY